MNKRVAAGIGLIAGALVGLYLLTTKKAKPCTEGTEKCDNGNLYACVNGKWELQELNSPVCVVPPSCSVDTDCPPGYVCDNGVCVPITPEVFYSPYGCVETTRGYWTSKQSLAESIVNGLLIFGQYPPPEESLDFRNCVIRNLFMGFYCPYCGGLTSYEGNMAGAMTLLSHIETSHPEFPLNKPPAWLEYVPLSMPPCALWSVLINGQTAYQAKYTQSIGHEFPYVLSPGNYHIEVTECQQWQTWTGGEPLRTELRCLKPYGPYNFNFTLANWGDRAICNANTNQTSITTWKELIGGI